MKPIEELKNIIEVTMLAAGEPVTVERSLKLFSAREQPNRDDIKKALKLRWAQMILCPSKPTAQESISKPARTSYLDL